LASFGKYELLALLSKTELSELWLARQGTAKYVLVKRLHERLGADQEYVDRFLDEARLASLLHHPNILAIYELGSFAGRHYVAMEYVEGLPVGLLVQRSIQRLGDLPIPIACNLVLQAATALHYAHDARDEVGEPLHVVHRDVSPANLLLGWDGTLKVADLGVATADGRRSHTTTGTVRGTPIYMAPEHISGKATDRRTDVFGLGIMLWELLAARRLFKRDTTEQTYDAIMFGDVTPASQYRPELPVGLDAITHKALAKAPADRYASVAELATALAHVLEAESLTASSEDVRAFLAEHFEPERREQARLVARVTKKPEVAAPLFSRSTHGLDFEGYSDGDTDRDSPAPWRAPCA
jgi:serine/threonine protein kinase